MDEKCITYQLNPLIEAQKSFDVMETRIFYLGLQDINPHITEKDKFYDTQFPDTVITPAELKEIFGHGQYIRELDKATDRLIGRYISIRYEDGFDKYTIFQHVRYKEGKGLFIKFNDDMRPFILDIYKGYKRYGFTKIEMQQIFFLGSAYAMRILELLLQYKSTAKNGIIERYIAIVDLREKLNVPAGAYQGKINNFKQFVLNKPIENINKNTQYHVSYDSVKIGRNITGFKLYCNCNKVIKDNEFSETVEVEVSNTESPKKRLELETEQARPFKKPHKSEPQNEEELEHLGRLGKYEIAPQTGRRLIKKYGWERIDANLKYAYEHRQRKENMSGWVIDCIKNDRAAGAAEAKRLAKKAADKKQKELLARLEPLPFEIEPPRELPADSPFKRFERKPHIKRAASKK